MMNMALIRVILVTVFFAQSVLSLKCYICNSVNDAECSKPSPPLKYLKECPQDSSNIAGDMYLHTKLQEVATAISPNPATTATPNTGVTAASVPSSPSNVDNANQTTREPYEQVSLEGAPGGGSQMPLPKEGQVCRKITFYISTQNNSPNNTLIKSERILRSCGWATSDETKDGKVKSGCKSTANKSVQMNQCLCTNGDGCNTGSHLAYLNLQTIILLAVAIVYCSKF